MSHKYSRLAREKLYHLIHFTAGASVELRANQPDPRMRVFTIVGLVPQIDGAVKNLCHRAGLVGPYALFFECYAAYALPSRLEYHSLINRQLYPYMYCTRIDYRVYCICSF